jgi:hypothetical protein
MYCEILLPFKSFSERNIDLILLLESKKLLLWVKFLVSINFNLLLLYINKCK